MSAREDELLEELIHHSYTTGARVAQPCLRVRCARPEQKHMRNIVMQCVDCSQAYPISVLPTAPAVDDDIFALQEGFQGMRDRAH